ncbi:hypothetical protein PMIT1327_02347 [Prochlorococcus marinus str. MIT 1327]|nr:hypothetical protein PMIT1327_02347 [Prochlorococcus marinus str. MIT 1327]
MSETVADPTRNQSTEGALGGLVKVLGGSLGNGVITFKGF